MTEIGHQRDDRCLGIHGRINLSRKQRSGKAITVTANPIAGSLCSKVQRNYLYEAIEGSAAGDDILRKSRTSARQVLKSSYGDPQL